SPPALGSAKVASCAAATAPAHGAACREHDRGHPQTPWTGSEAPSHSAQLAVCRAPAPVRRTERGLVRRLQRALRRWQRSMPSADDYGRLQPLPAPLPGPASAALSVRATSVRVGVPRVRTTASDPYRQRSPVLLVGARRSVATRGVVGPAGSPPGTHHAGT